MNPWAMFFAVVALTLSVKAGVAAEINGTVTGLDGTSVIIALDSDLQPNVGDRVEISFKTADDEIPVGTWQVSKVDGATVTATLVEAEGEATLDMSAVIYSDIPRETTGAKDIVPPSLPPPARPEPVVVEPAPVDIGPETAEAAIQAGARRIVLSVSLLSQHEVSERGKFRLGVHYQTEIRPFMPIFGMSEPRGSFVISVTGGSPAEAAGILPGDMIVRLGNRTVDQPGALGRLIEETPSTIPVKVEIIRFGNGADDFLSRLAADAERGDTGALTALGELAFHGFRGGVDYAEAFRLFRMAANAGDGFAAYRLGGMHMNGNGTPVDHAKATRWFHFALEQGQETAYLSIANLYWRGQYWDGSKTVRNNIEALRYFRTAADLGVAGSYFYIGAAYHLGRGVSVDGVEAMRWYKKSIAATGDSSAIANLGRLYYRGGDVPRDFAEARRLFEQAIEAGNTDVISLLGMMYRDGNSVPVDKKKAESLFRKGAAAGARDSMYLLGIMLNRSSNSSDKSEAINWIRKASDAGDADADYALAVAYLRGRGVARDLDRAAHYLVQAMGRGGRVAIEEIKTNSRGWDRSVLRGIQKRLRERGHYSGKIDGSFGPQTLRAIDALVAASRRP